MMETLYVPPLFLQLGLAHVQPTASRWVSKSGIRLTAYGSDGVPFRRARLIILYFADKAIESGKRITGKLTDIREHFALDWSERSLEPHFRRVVECRYDIQEADLTCSCRQCYLYRAMPVVAAYRYCDKTQTFTVELTDDFVDSVRNGIRCSRRVVLSLMHSKQLAALELYVWLQQRLQAGDHRTVDIAGPDGPFASMDGPKRATKARQTIREYMTCLRSIWPECPFRIAHDVRKLAHVDSLTKLIESPAAPSNDQAHSEHDRCLSSDGISETTELSGLDDLRDAFSELTERIDELRERTHDRQRQRSLVSQTG